MLQITPENKARLHNLAEACVVAFGMSAFCKEFSWESVLKAVTIGPSNPLGVKSRVKKKSNDAAGSQTISPQIFTDWAEIVSRTLQGERADEVRAELEAAREKTLNGFGMIRKNLLAIADHIEPQDARRAKFIRTQLAPSLSKKSAAKESMAETLGKHQIDMESVDLDKFLLD